MRLSILIATMPSRINSFSQLCNSINEQGFFDQTELLHDDNMGYNIGIKRNRLLERAKGDYVIFADDDDAISPDYIAKILAATETNPDCIGISGTITFNGTNRRQWHISKEYGHWYEYQSIYYRTPNHISPVRRGLALQAGFPEIAFGEDAEYSKRLLPLLKSEVVVEGNIYEYRYVQK